MTPDLVNQLLAREAATNAFTGTCPQLFDLILAGNQTYTMQINQIMSVLQKSRLENVHITGDTAQFDVRYAFRGQTSKFPGQEKRMNGAWRIACCLGSG